ncbi:hypothetical protein PVK06_030822 [Gossypium arboreum]|uniref:Uncharacterized protein n=1 Tax=Gossypium arboreum TaxID=29729 RepID=A0ABR0NRX7_GOSAR|nr:hypothetical protein PVK06_030822 [Gossypium arboreum]
MEAAEVTALIQLTPHPPSFQFPAGFYRFGFQMADFKHGEDDHEGKAAAKKYGGLVPKKPPLISKDHERAFFDSADWAICKVFLTFQIYIFFNLFTIIIRTPHPQLPPRRPACTSGGDNTVQ